MLIKCPECQSSISDKAHACPYCGYPIQEYLNNTPESSGASSNNDTSVSQNTDSHHSISSHEEGTSSKPNSSIFSVYVEQKSDETSEPYSNQESDAVLYLHRKDGDKYAPTDILHQTQ